MGDRRNVIVKDDDSTVYLYTHWTGYELPTTVQSALERGRDRWSDGPYLARIIFDEMVKFNAGGTSGFGISSVMQDTDYFGAEVELDIQSQTVRIGKQSWTLEEFSAASQINEEAS